MCNSGPENILHLFRHCKMATVLWNHWKRLGYPHYSTIQNLDDWLSFNLHDTSRIGCGLQWQKLFAYSLLCLWKWRCASIFQTDYVRPKEQLRFVLTMANEWDNANSISLGLTIPKIRRNEWSAPIQDFVKLNSDGSCLPNLVIVVGGVIRDANAQWVIGYSFLGTGSPLLAESQSSSPRPPPMSTAGDSPYSKYEIRHRVPNPGTAALLVIDVQNYFSTIAAPILPALRSTIHLCRAANIPVIYTRHRHRSPSDHGMLAEWWDHHLVLDATPDSLLHPDISRLDGDLVVEKSTYSAFLGTGLEETLRGMGVEEVIVTGVMTNLCCETTARDAFCRGFRVFFSVDATATSTAELHQATLKNMAYGFAYLVDCNSLKDDLRVTT